MPTTNTNEDMSSYIYPLVAVRRRLSMSFNPAKAPIPSGALSRIIWHLLRICLSFSLLPVDNTILVVAGFLVCLRSAANRRRVARTVRPHPRTVLITGVGTAHGLALARSWAAKGHRVVGADVTDLNLPVRSGGSLSKAIVTFYQISKDHYVSRLLDIIQREKVDLWIPCSPNSTSIEDGMTRQVIESRTSCKCIALQTELANCFADPHSFRLYLIEQELPVLEYHTVRSRDAVHKILHRSPTKSYQISRATPSATDKTLLLPRRTLSNTYTSISEIQITKERPWILQQQARLGEVFADLLVVRGHVQAIKVRLSDSHPSTRGSRLDKALDFSVHKLMQTFAAKGGVCLTGHLTIKLMVDEEFDAHSVRHTIYIAGCTSGAETVENLMYNEPCSLISGYLFVFPSDPVEIAHTTPTLLPAHSKPTFPRAAILSAALQFSLFHYLFTALEVARTELGRLFFWNDPLFSVVDPVPWWWQVHVYQPLREIWGLVKQIREAGLTS
ncbi:O-methyltransferase family 3 [Penicillium bovifimosum]|uniref:O-methyltransferase family 3 n=1 Tax=Penicillium bovifimosum TaxID=126998 RepID=A0A9W9LB03_9EURO|nr:O-methyltransferase family 3 [Penicillium bovifimosum]KAJ5145782.1 O-methyltransferase family 3 [Penicillium bovifimosum]